MVKFACGLSRSGVPVMYESGGCDGVKGMGSVVCDAQGSMKRALYIVKRCVNGHHAVIPVVAGDYYIEARQVKQRFSVFVWRIDAVNAGGTSVMCASMKCEQVPELQNAIAAAKRIATTMNATHSVFCIDPMSLHEVNV